VFHFFKLCALQCYCTDLISDRMSVTETAETDDAVLRRMRSLSIFEAIEADDAAVIEAHASRGTDLNVCNRCALIAESWHFSRLRNACAGMSAQRYVQLLRLANRNHLKRSQRVWRISMYYANTREPQCTWPLKQGMQHASRFLENTLQMSTSSTSSMADARCMMRHSTVIAPLHLIYSFT